MGGSACRRRRNLVPAHGARLRSGHPSQELRLRLSQRRILLSKVCTAETRICCCNIAIALTIWSMHYETDMTPGSPEAMKMDSRVPGVDFARRAPGRPTLYVVV